MVEMYEAFNQALKLEKMKKRNIFQLKLGFILLLLSLNACVDVLDVVPSDKLSIDRLLNKQAQVLNFRNNCYNNLNSSFTDQSSGQLLEAFSDDAFRAGTGPAFDWHNAQLSPNRDFFAGSIWNQCWEGIRKCNLALLYLPQSKVSKDQITDNELAIWMSEVKGLRAWYHFMLIKNFGPVPFVDEPFNPDFAGWSELTRPTYDEIASRIADECDEVIADGLLPLRWQTNTDYDRMNLAAVYALKSRVLLYNASELNNPNSDQAKWQRAATASQQCLDVIGSEYSLISIESYDNLFNESANVLNSEIILRSRNNGSPIMNNANGVDLRDLGSAIQNSNCGAVPTQELVDCFELSDGALPVVAYNNADHVNVSFSDGYSEDPGDNIYEGRDKRLESAIVFNGSAYGKYKGQPAASPELVIYTYEGKPGTGFNSNPNSQEESDKRRSTTGYYGRKFRSASYWGSTAGGTNAHKIYFRLAEVYLNLAEANCELEQLDDAITALNVVRERAGQPQISDVPGFVKTKDFLMQRIRNERRVELCFEGHRFYDQRRWNILNQTNGVVSGMKITSAGGDAGPFSYERVKIETVRNAVSDKYLVLPLSEQEARRLDGMGQPAAWQ